MGGFSQTGNIHISRQGHASGMNFKDFAAACDIRNANNNFPVKSPWTPQRRIQRVGKVSSRNHNDLAARFQAIHQCK